MFQTAYTCSKSYVKSTKQFEQALLKSTAYNYLLEKLLKCHFSYVGNWELVKSFMGTKSSRSHVCLHSQVG